MTELSSHIVPMPLIGDWAQSQVCRKSDHIHSNAFYHGQGEQNRRVTIVITRENRAQSDRDRLVVYLREDRKVHKNGPDL